jgi:hypothetical protein
MFRKKQPPAQNRSAGSPGGARVFSYYASRSRSDEGTGRGNLPTPKRERSKTLPLLLVAGLMMALAAALLSLGTEVRVTAQSAAKPGLLKPTEEYTQEAERIMRSSILNRTKITVDSDRFEAAMKERFPELEAAVLTVPLIGRKPTLILQPAEPVLLLYGEGGRYVVDSNGRALMRVEEVPSSIRKALPAVMDESGLPINRNELVLSKRATLFIRHIHHQLVAKEIKAASFVMPPIPEDLHVRIEGEGYIVKFNMAGDAKVQAGAFLATKKRLDDEKKVADEYIDVRLEDRAYYR